MALDFLNYDKMRENGREFLRKDHWEASFITTPGVVYVPPQGLLNLRVTSFTTAIDSEISGIEADLRGYNVKQKGKVKTSGSITLTMIDREDQSLAYMKDSWAEAICGRDTMFSNAKSDLVADIKLTMYNSSRIPVRTLTFYSCQPNENELNEVDFADDASANLGELSLTLDFEHYRRSILSAPLS